MSDMTTILTADRRWQPVGLAATTLDVSTEWSSTWRELRLRRDTIAVANPWVLSAWQARADLSSVVPIHVFDRTGAEPVRVRSGDPHPLAGLARLLGDVADPARRTSALRWRRLVDRDRLIHGNAATRVLLRGANVVGLRRVKWADVRALEDGDAYRIGDEVVDAREVVHVRMLEGEDGVDGVSPLASLSATNELHDLATEFALRFLDQGVWPSGVLELPHNATLEQARATRKLIEAAYTGTENAGKPIVGFGKWHQVSATPEAARLVELSRASREEVAGAFRVPLSVLGDARDTNKATADADRTRFVRDVVGSDVAALEAELRAQLVAERFPGAHVEAQLGALLRPDMEAMARVLNLEVGGPTVTANEARTKYLGLPILDDPAADRLNLAPGTDRPEDDADDTDDEDDE